MSEKIEKYGLKWPASSHPLQIEMAMIKRGGKFITKETGVEVGNGLPFHYEEMRKIIWPELDSHRWHQLILGEIRRPNAKVTVLMGPGSSSKTHEAACNYLMEYYCFPSETCVLISSTDMRGLELRVWGEIKSLHERAKARFDFIPGFLIDSKHAICTDDIEEEGARDLRAGVIGIPTVSGGKSVGLSKWVGVKQKRIRLVADECFPAGTLVDTPIGSVPIEKIKAGDLVYCAAGIGAVEGVMKKTAKQLVKVTSKDGRSFLCTPEHPVLTQLGWIKACNLNQSHLMLSSNECVQTLQETNPQQTFLRKLLQCELAENAGGERKVLYKRKNRQDSGRASQNLLRESRSLRSYASKAAGGNDSLHEFAHAGAEVSSKQKDEQDFEGLGTQAVGSRWKRDRENQARGGSFVYVPGCGLELRRPNHAESWKRLSHLLQIGHSISEAETWGGGGREQPRNDVQKGAGRKEGSASCGSWVDSCEIQEQANLRAAGGSESGIAVYNLQVAGHPSYSVSGFIVHNCQFMGVSFLSAFANLDKNEDFQAVVLGNPVDFNDPLGKAAEPRDGWKNHMEPTKTECWDTRFMNGRCVNLVGTDSPNFDFPADQPARYKYLISREKIANTLSFFPENSLEYYSQCIGVMKVAGMERRVLTRDIIRQYKADQDTAFQGETIKVYFVDAARGGDKCVGGHGEFGINVEGRNVLRLGEPKVIPIIVGSGTDPEYQIANFVKQDCTVLGVNPSNMGHDATGWGSLGTALAVVWSNQTVPVEAGGSASSRPVCNDLFINDDKTNPPTKRLKLCHEHYDKRTSEFWFSMRYATESSQIANLPDEAVEDLIERKWDYSRGNKIMVESKSSRMKADGTRNIGMKERIGRSPDYGDWACGILEIARRRGFMIERLGKQDDTKKSDILQKLALKQQKLLSSRQLQNA